MGIRFTRSETRRGELTVRRRICYTIRHESADFRSSRAGKAMQKRTMKRLKGFDYRRPFFYMVTLKRLKGLQPFCEICRDNPPPKDAQGRMLFLSLYPVLNRTPTKAELYRRCHEMGDLAAAGLAETDERSAAFHASHGMPFQPE